MTTTGSTQPSNLQEQLLGDLVQARKMMKRLQLAVIEDGGLTFNKCQEIHLLEACLDLRLAVHLLKQTSAKLNSALRSTSLEIEPGSGLFGMGSTFT